MSTLTSIYFAIYLIKLTISKIICLVSHRILFSVAHSSYSLSTYQLVVALYFGTRWLGKQGYSRINVGSSVNKPDTSRRSNINKYILLEGREMRVGSRSKDQVVWAEKIAFSSDSQRCFVVINVFCISQIA